MSRLARVLVGGVVLLSTSVSSVWAEQEVCVADDDSTSCPRPIVGELPSVASEATAVGSTDVPTAGSNVDEAVTRMLEPATVIQPFDAAAAEPASSEPVMPLTVQPPTQRLPPGPPNRLPPGPASRFP